MEPTIDTANNHSDIKSNYFSIFQDVSKIPTLPTQDNKVPRSQSLQGSSWKQQQLPWRQHLPAHSVDILTQWLKTWLKTWKKSDINPRNFMFNIERNISALLQFYSCLGNTFNFTELGYKKHFCSHGQARGELLLGPRFQHGHEQARIVSVWVL